MVQSKRKPSSLDEKLIAYLGDRYFFISQQGNQAFYYDSLNDQGKGITKQHLVGALIEKGLQLTGINDLGDPIEYGLDLISRTNAGGGFRPINLNYDYYRPELSKVITVNGHHYRNLWRKPDVEPDSRADSKPFIKHLTDMLGSKKKADYLIDMLAYRYQKGHIDSKPHIAFYFYGELQGMGKSLLATTLTKVFGESAVSNVSDERALESMSAIDVWRRTWLIMEETSFKVGSNAYKDIKAHTGKDHSKAPRKGEHFNNYEIPAQLIILSNHAPTFLESGDRRFFISKWQKKFDTPEDKDAYFRDYLGWLHHGGYAAIAGILKERDISKVKLESPAPITSEKEIALAITTDPVVEEMKIELAEKPNKHLWVEEEFQDIFDRYHVNKNQMKYKLADAGLVVEGKSYRYEGISTRFCTREDYIIRHHQGMKPQVINPLGVKKDLDDFPEYKECIDTIKQVRNINLY